MPTVNVSELGDAFVIHFDTEGERINAYTLASTLVGIADAAKAANAAVNLGYDIEIVVEAIGPGSFRAFVRAVYKQAGNLFSSQNVKAVILSVVASFIYERTLAVNHPLTVEVRTDEVIVTNGTDRVIVPRNVYDATRLAEKNPQFVRSVGKTLEAASSDDHVKGIGFVPKMDSPKPDMVIPKDTMRSFEIDTTSDPDSRVIEERADVQIIKAILEKSARKWEFMWRGFKISAPVLDDRFYSQFFAHEIMIAPGDELSVRMAIRQSRDRATGIYANTGYEIVEVYAHKPRLRQVNILETPPVFDGTTGSGFTSRSSESSAAPTPDPINPSNK